MEGDNGERERERERGEKMKATSRSKSLVRLPRTRVKREGSLCLQGRCEVGLRSLNGGRPGRFLVEKNLRACACCACAVPVFFFFFLQVGFSGPAAPQQSF
jgi:hypothetical protein